MNILFVADPLESFKTYKDTTFSMMRELQKRGHAIAATEPRHMGWRSGGAVSCQVPTFVVLREGACVLHIPARPASRHLGLSHSACLSAATRVRSHWGLLFSSIFRRHGNGLPHNSAKHDTHNPRNK